MRYLKPRLSPDAFLDHAKTPPCQNAALDAIHNKLSTHRHSKLFILHTKWKKINGEKKNSTRITRQVKSVANSVLLSRGILTLRTHNISKSLWFHKRRKPTKSRSCFQLPEDRIYQVVWVWFAYEPRRKMLLNLVLKKMNKIETCSATRRKGSLSFCWGSNAATRLVEDSSLHHPVSLMTLQTKAIAKPQYKLAATTIKQSI